MNCPHCQKVLPENSSGKNCPHCGKSLQPEVATASSLAPVRIKWLIFFGVLLAPPLITMFAAFLGKGQENEQASPVIAVFGGAGCGIACGIMLALRLGRTSGARVLLGLLFSVIFAVVCITLSCFGCLAVGYQLSFH
jgi:hypothetical protein